MSGKLIFKMEMFKFIKDKSYLITAGVLAVLNIIATSFIIQTVSNAPYYMYSNTSNDGMLALMGMTTGLVMIANWIFIFVYPFHILSMDYKNNVMAMMIASGVNRTKLFFAKIGAVIASTIILSLAIGLIPLIMIIVKLSGTVGLTDITDGFFSIFGIFDFSVFQMIFFFILSYLNTLVMISTASVLMKGSNVTFFVFIGFSMGLNIFKGIFAIMFGGYTYDGSITMSIISTLIAMIFFGFIALKTLQKQNL